MSEDYVIEGCSTEPPPSRAEQRLRYQTLHHFMCEIPPLSRYCEASTTLERAKKYRDSVADLMPKIMRRFSKKQLSVDEFAEFMDALQEIEKKYEQKLLGNYIAYLVVMWHEWLGKPLASFPVNFLTDLVHLQKNITLVLGAGAYTDENVVFIPPMTRIVVLKHLNEGNLNDPKLLASQTFDEVRQVKAYTEKAIEQGKFIWTVFGKDRPIIRGR